MSEFYVTHLGVQKGLEYRPLAATYQRMSRMGALPRTGNGAQGYRLGSNRGLSVNVLTRAGGPARSPTYKPQRVAESLREGGGDDQGVWHRSGTVIVRVRNRRLRVRLRYFGQQAPAAFQRCHRKKYEPPGTFTRRNQTWRKVWLMCRLLGRRVTR
jgi:hypothetical protein